MTTRCTPTPDALAHAARVLREGGLVAFPTETVYGLGADATNGQAVARIFEAKGRPAFNPLIVHVADVQAAERLACFDPTARALAVQFWPGPLTLVLPRQPDCPAHPLVSAGLDTIALRMPDHPVAQALLKAAGIPLAAPSANRSGHVTATSADHVAADLEGRVALILDDGPTRCGLESTVLSLAGPEPVLLRPGTISAADLAIVLGRHPARRSETGSRLTAPGQLESHYAPAAPVRLDAKTVAPDEALLAFGPNPPPGARATINLSPTGDLVEAAARLFAALRQLDVAGAKRIAVMPIPTEGLGEAINDRLRRAAAPR